MVAMYVTALGWFTGPRNHFSFHRCVGRGFVVRARASAPPSLAACGGARDTGGDADQSVSGCAAARVSTATGSIAWRAERKPSRADADSPTIAPRSGRFHYSPRRRGQDRSRNHARALRLSQGVESMEVSDRNWRTICAQLHDYAHLRYVTTLGVSCGAPRPVSVRQPYVSGFDSVPSGYGDA